VHLLVYFESATFLSPKSPSLTRVKKRCQQEQWDINNELLLKSFEDEEEDKEETYNTSSDQNMELDEESLHNLDNAIEAMDIAGRKRGRFSYEETSLKNEGESEKPHRSAGKWPPEKEDHTYNYIPGQYRYMGSNCREFERVVKFQNQKSDGAVLNLAAHDPIDWPNIISVWKGLIVQKYIQNQFNIKNKVEDMITYLETFLGEAVKVLWEQWVENYPTLYAELKRA